MREHVNISSGSYEMEKEIRGYLNAIGKGFKEGGIRQNVKPKHIQTVCVYVAEATVEEFADFVADVMGETAGLASGGSSMSKEAMQSVNDAQAMWFYQLREHTNTQAASKATDKISAEDLVSCQKMLALHKESLVKWIQTGKTYLDPINETGEVKSELSEFSSLLTSADLRLGVMAAFLGALEASYQGLMFFQN